MFRYRRQPVPVRV